MESLLDLWQPSVFGQVTIGPCAFVRTEDWQAVCRIPVMAPAEHTAEV